MKRRLGKDVAAYLHRVQKQIQSEYGELDSASEFSIGVEYKLALTKKPGDADIVFNSGTAGKPGIFVQVPKDSSISHPFRQTELLEKLKTPLLGLAIANQHDIQCINSVYGVKKRLDWFYQGTVAGSPAQYSEAFVAWIVDRMRQDSGFFTKARESAKKKKN